MRVLLLGAGGFIGRQILAELLSAGHDVLGVVRRSYALKEAFPSARLGSLDLAEAVTVDSWSSHLAGVEIIVNCAGVLRGRGMVPVHVDMPRALYAAARTAQVRRVVLISAISARADVATDYARSKLAGEAVLRESGLGWTILRPSLVHGEGSYGGTSLARGLSALPFLVPLPGDGRQPFSPIHVRDMARTVRIVCEDERFAGRMLEPVGPDTISLAEILMIYRRWLGFGAAMQVRIPMSLMWGMARIGDLVGSGPVSTNSLAQTLAGNAGDGQAFEQAIGFRPRGLVETLRRRPAQVQDRWHARLYFVAPTIRAVLVILWLASAWLGLLHGYEAARAVTGGLGLAESSAEPLRLAGSLIDLAMAAMVLGDRIGRWATMAQLAVITGYTILISAALPALWLDPLGPLLKNMPILVLVLVHGAIADRR
jgi:uncharacterized protein YbjT (DUF2867 family)